MKDDALDHQLQDSLPFGDADRLQAGTNAFAEERFRFARVSTALSLFRTQAAVLFVLLLKDAPLFGQGATLLGPVR